MTHCFPPFLICSIIPSGLQDCQSDIMSTCRPGKSRDDTWIPAWPDGRKERLVDRPDQVLDLLGMRAKLLGQLVEIGVGNCDKARFVDVADDLDADRLQLVLRLVLE